MMRDTYRITVANITFTDITALSITLSFDGDLGNFSFTVPKSDAVIDALNAVSRSTRGIKVPSESVPMPSQQQQQPQQSQLPKPQSGIPSGPTPENEADRVRAIIAECRRQGVTQIEQIAYILATAEHECGRLGTVNGKNGYFIPVKEFGSNLRYDPWRGRGLVQLTWEFNYRRYQELTGRPLLQDPDLVIKDFGLSCFILVHGSKNGIFTGKSVGDYIKPGSVDFYNARRVINGLDRASYIAGLAEQWVSRLQRGQFTVSGGSSNTAVSAVSPSPVISQSVQIPSAPTSGEITANIIIEYPGVDTITGFYTGYQATDTMLQIFGSGFRRLRELTANPLKPQIRVPNFAADGTSDYFNGGKTKIVRIENPLSVTQSDTIATQLSVIKDGLVRGFPGTITIPHSPEILPGDIVVCRYLRPSGDYRVNEVSTDGFTTQLSVYLPTDSYVTLPSVADSSGNSSGNSSGSKSASPVPTDGSTLSKLLAAALANEGKPSGTGYSPAVCNNGRLACAWAINEYVFKPVFGRTFGDNPLLVTSVESALIAAGWKEVAEPPPGAICTAVRMPVGGGHIGIIIGPGIMSLSNSSSRAAFASRYEWVPYMSQVYAPAKIRYLVPPG